MNICFRAGQHQGVERRATLCAAQVLRFLPPLPPRLNAQFGDDAAQTGKNLVRTDIELAVQGAIDQL